LYLYLEPGFGEWVQKLEIYEYYTGIYILIAAGLLIMMVSFIGCVTAFMESRMLIIIVRDYVAIRYNDASTR
jgi:hypothetical protein